MIKKISLWFVCCNLFLLLGSSVSYSEIRQIFVGNADSEPGQILALPVYILNGNGMVDASFNGEKQFEVNIQELGRLNQSYQILEKSLIFTDGKSALSIQNEDAEDISILLKIEGIDGEGQSIVHFKPAAIPEAVSKPVNTDTSGPEITDISVEDMNVIKLKFSEKLDQSSAVDTDNYTAVTNKKEVHPKTVEYRGDYVVLKFSSSFHQDETGYIEVRDLYDVNGNKISALTRSDNFDGKCPCTD